MNGTRTIRRGKPPAIRTGGRRSTSSKFSTELLRIHDNVLAKARIPPAESNELLLEGNRHFVDGVHTRRLNLPALMERPIDEVLWVCSDARAGLIINPHMQIKKRFAIGFVAGNVISFQHPASARIITGTIDGLRDRGNIRVIGHVQCGAVNHADGQGNENQPLILRPLLNLAVPGNELANARTQLTRLVEYVCERHKGKGFSLSSNVFDWNNTQYPLQVENESASDMAIVYRLKYTSRFVGDFDQELGKIPSMDTQYAHAVAVTSIVDDWPIPATLREVFSVYTPNELFCVTANSHMKHAPGFDELSLGSIFYSLANNETNNVVLVHANDVVLAAWTEELKTWFRQLAKSENDTEHEIGNKFLRGEIAISCMQFDVNTGEVHLFE